MIKKNCPVQLAVTDAVERPYGLIRQRPGYRINGITYFRNLQLHLYYDYYHNYHITGDGISPPTESSLEALRLYESRALIR